MRTDLDVRRRTRHRRCQASVALAVGRVACACGPGSSHGSVGSPRQRCWVHAWSGSRASACYGWTSQWVSRVKVVMGVGVAVSAGQSVKGRQGLPTLPEPGQVVEVRGSTWAVSNVQAQGLPRSPADEAVAHLSHVVDLQSLDEGAWARSSALSGSSKSVTPSHRPRASLTSSIPMASTSRRRSPGSSTPCAGVR